NPRRACAPRQSRAFEPLNKMGEATMNAASSTATLTDIMANLGHRARAAASVLAHAPAEKKTEALRAAARAIHTRRAEILAANEEDMAAARAGGMGAAFLDRLLLDDKRLDTIVAALETVAGL